MFATFHFTCSSAPFTLPTEVKVTGFPGWSIRSFPGEQQTSRENGKGGEAHHQWPRPQRADDFWIRRSTLDFLSRSNPGFTTEGMVLRHAASGRRVLLTVQTFLFRAGEQVSGDAKGKTSRWDLRRRLLKRMSSKVIVIGQLLTSGDYAQDGTDTLSATELSQLLPAIGDTLKNRGARHAAILIKDLFPLQSPLTGLLKEQGFTLLPTESSMVLPLRNWSSIEDYLLDLSSKYRVRYRRARSKLGDLTRKRLSHEKVTENIDRIFELYLETSAGADFNLTKLTKDYFLWLGEVGNLFAYYDGDEMVGFTTSIPNGETLHAHYLGLRDTYKYSHHLYHNMLYDLLEDAISGRFARLDYGRTAPEIKSSIGAVGQEYPSLVRARSGIINRLVPVFVPAVFSLRPWTPRNPFK